MITAPRHAVIAKFVRQNGIVGEAGKRRTGGGSTVDKHENLLGLN